MRKQFEDKGTTVEVGARRSGRTTAAVEWFRESDDRVLVVHALAEKHRIVRQYGLQSEQEDRIIVASEVAERLRGRRNAEVGIDNADMLLEALLASYTTADLIEVLTGVRPDYITETAAVDGGPDMRPPRPSRRVRINPATGSV